MTSSAWRAGPPACRTAYVVRDVTPVGGGQGLVFKARRHTFPGDPVGFAGDVSLKLHPNTGTPPLTHAQRLVETLAALDHPSLGRPLEVFDGPGLAVDPDSADTHDDVRYFASVWVPGRPLRELAPLPVDAAGRVLAAVASAVALLHRNGLVHRDLHPDNVIVREDGTGVVVDFDSVLPEGDAGATATGSVGPAAPAGTIGFVPPGDAAGSEAVAADRWGVGMLAAFAVLGHPQGSTSSDEFVAMLARRLRGHRGRQLLGLITSMIAVDPRERPTDLEWWADDVAAASRARRRWPLLAGAAVVVLGAGIGAWVATRDDGASPDAGPVASAATLETATTAASTAPATTPAAACPPVEVTPEPVDFALPPVVCVAATEALADGRVQRLVDDAGRPAGVLVARPDADAPVYLTPAMWASYSDIVGRGEPLNSVVYAGYPERVEYVDDPAAVIVHLDTGGIMVGPRDDSALFWIPGEAVDDWERTGGLGGELGFPVANRRVTPEGATIEFERGTLHAPPEQVGPIQAGQPVPLDVTTVEPVDVPDVPAAGGILRQWGGSAWWVDGNGVRHWIADDATWECLGGDDAVIADRLHGWVVWGYPLGAPAHCT